MKKVHSKTPLIARGRSKEGTIEEFISVRRKLIDTLNTIDDEKWNEEFSIGKTSKTLLTYFQGSIEFDIHHFRQISKVLNISF